MTAAITNRTRSARTQSSMPPARMGRIITPGENHHADTCTAATPMATMASARLNASRRFRVMNCLLSTARTCCTRARRPCAATRQRKVAGGKP